MAARRPLVLVDGQIRQMTVDEFNDLRWQLIPIGAEFPIDSTATGVDIPPTDNPNYRYIKLTASDSYNTGVLTSESVSGSAPLVQATAVINYPASPMHGQTVRLINTERRVIRAGSSGTVEADALQGHKHGATLAAAGATTSGGKWTQGAGGVGGATVSGAFLNSGLSGATGPQVLTDDPYSDGVNGATRTANETRVKSLGRDYYKRIG